MADGFEVDHAVMATGATGGGNIALDVKATADGLIAQLSGLTWRGDGATAFETAKEALRIDLQTISDALLALSGRLGTASTGYRTVDTDAGSTVTRAAAGLGGVGPALRGLV